MHESTIYSIGHGNKTFEEFLSELKKYQIDYVFDVRSNPVSKFNYHFNRSWLEIDLPDNHITYQFLGEYLGGLPKNKKYYTQGKVDYSKLSISNFFLEGIKLLVEANNENLRIALMCSETKPEECHRSKLIGQELLKHNVSINHITSDGIKSQEKIIEKLTEGFGAQDLFGEKDFSSRNTYL